MPAKRSAAATPVTGAIDHALVRRLALGLPETAEKAHLGKADFRVRDRIFATLPDDGHVVVKLTPEQQAIMMDDTPGAFEPAAGAWGRGGWTRVSLAAVDELTLRSALLTAWRNISSGKLAQAFDAASWATPR